MSFKIYIEPRFRGQDAGEGGIRRIVEAQRRWLPQMGVEVVEEIEDADVVATHAGMTPDVPQDIAWVVHTHGLYWQEYEWPKWCHTLNRDVIEAMRRADHVTAPSEWVAQALRRGMWLRPTVLQHGVDLEEWEPFPTHAGYVLWNKNRADPVCDPKPLMDLANMAPELAFVTTIGHDQANVRVTGRIGFDAMRDLVKNAGVYLCTTRETFGIGTLEAMAAGVPVVGWSWGGQRDIIQHGKTGWLCPPGDYAGLIEGIKWALKHRKRVAANARAAVKERWTWDKRMRDYVTLYEEVVEEKRQRLSGPAVSVVVPCYKLAHLLPDTIASLQAQSMTDWEAIIVNDASPDGTAKVAAKLAREDPRVRVVTNRENLYLAGTLNAGIAEAKGRHILPLDADNMIEPWTLEVLSSALDQDRGIHVAYGACRFVLEDGVTRDTSISPDGVSGWPPDFSFRAQMMKRNQIPSTSMFRREVWERTGGYRRRLRTAEDAENWTRVASIGFVPKKVTSRVTLIYRQRPDSMSRVETETDWTAWFPWSRHIDLVPFGVGELPPQRVNGGLSWHVSSYEPTKIVVVIPVGPGHEQLLIDALDSVEAQTFREWECVVVNDTGHPLHVPHPWARVLNTEGGVGPAAARNLGIASTTAPLIVPLDADDYLQPDALSLMLETWNEQGGVVYSQWYDDQGAGEALIYDPPEYDAHLLVSKGTIHAVTALYPRSAWLKVGGFDERLSHWEDWDFQLKLASHGICGTRIPRPLFTYRKTTGLRREANRAAFEEGKNAILAKWSRLWDGRETLMACGGCPGGGGRPYATPPLVQRSGQQMLQPREGYVVLQYKGVSPSTRMYRGKGTGTNYRFGNNPAHQVKYVFGQDVPDLLALMDGGRPLFEILTPSALEERPAEPQLVTAGAATQPSDSPVAAVETLAPTAAAPAAVVEAPPAPEAGTPLQEYTVSELRLYLDTWSIDQVSRYLAHEEAKEAPRVGAIAALRSRAHALLS